MASFTLVQLSDTHLSPSRPYFQFNYEIVIEELAALKPDHIVITGDLALNGPDDIADVAFARRQFERLPAPWSAIPGNHDVGLVPFTADVHQPLTAARQQLYLDHMGEDRFALELGDWRLIGFNSQLLGSGHPSEEPQYEWLAQEMARSPKPLALFLHYPLFLDDVADTTPSHSMVLPTARARVLALIDQHPHVRLVASGHLHEDRQVMRNHVAYQWAPSIAFMNGNAPHGGNPNAGFLVYRFTDASFTVERIEPRFFFNHDVRNWARSEPHGYYEIIKRPFPSVA